MLRLRSIVCLLTLVICCGGLASAATFSGGGFTIFDNAGRVSTGCSTVAVSGFTSSAVLSSISYKGFTHSSLGDLELRVYLPGAAPPPSINAGESFVVSGPPDTRPCDLSGDYRFIDTALQSVDAATQTCGDASVIAAGDYRTSTYGGGSTDGLTTSLSSSPGVLSAGQVNGNWLVCAFDLAAGDAGAVTSTQLVINAATPTPTPTPTPGPSSIQFSTGNYTVGEGDGHVDITVTRSGDVASSSVSVDYTTVDQTPGAGHASQSSDYEIATGTVSFAAGEVSKTFTVLIVDDKFVEGNETIGLSLSNPKGSNVSLGSQSSATLTIVDNDTSSTTVNPYDDARFFVRQHYLDFLNREPDQSGWDFWTNEITQCGADAPCTEVKRINVSAAYFLSIEFQSTGYEAYLTHRAAFGPTAPNSPVPVLYNTFMHDVQELGKGYVFGAPGADAILEANKQAYFNDFVNRPEFLAKYPADLTNLDLVDNLLTTAKLPITGTFHDTLVNSLNGGSMTRASVMRSVAESSTLRTREFNNAFVAMEYFGYLRRDPDTPGYNFWLGKLNSFNGNYIQAEMVKAFISATEVRQRFGSN